MTFCKESLAKMKSKASGCIQLTNLIKLRVQGPLLGGCLVLCLLASIRLQVSAVEATSKTNRDKTSHDPSKEELQC